MPLNPLSILRRRLASEVITIFNDRSRGETPVVRRPEESWFRSSSITWRVHGDITTMMIGGVTGLLLQMLHPAVLAGVWDHSNFRADMHGRLRRTARFIATTTFAAEADARAAIERVRRIHGQVAGTLLDGSEYRADDPRLLAWVHVTESWSFLAAWVRYAEPSMPMAQQDAYFAEMSRVAIALGADPVPRTRASAESLIAQARPALRVDARTRSVARLVLDQQQQKLSARLPHSLIMRAGVDLLPAWARRMHQVDATLPIPLLRAGTFALAETLRWAFGES